MQEKNYEVFWGFFGVLIASLFIIICAFLTPNYNPLYNTVSSLGSGIAKTLFSIGFIVAGSCGIPFYIFISKEELNGINDDLQHIATGVAIFTCICIALVGVLPDSEYPNTFLLFHGFVAFIAFVGSSTYICLYTYLMLKSGNFSKFHIIIGFLTGFFLLILALTRFNPLIEWILTLNIMLWILITGKRFF